MRVRVRERVCKRTAQRRGRTEPVCVMATWGHKNSGEEEVRKKRRFVGKSDLYVASVLCRSPPSPAKVCHDGQARITITISMVTVCVACMSRTRSN